MQRGDIVEVYKNRDWKVEYGDYELGILLEKIRSTTSTFNHKGDNYIGELWKINLQGKEIEAWIRVLVEEEEEIPWSYTKSPTIVDPYDPITCVEEGQEDVIRQSFINNQIKKLKALKSYPEREGAILWHNFIRKPCKETKLLWLEWIRLNKEGYNNLKNYINEHCNS